MIFEMWLLGLPCHRRVAYLPDRHPFVVMPMHAPYSFDSNLVGNVNKAPAEMIAPLEISSRPHVVREPKIIGLER